MKKIKPSEAKALNQNFIKTRSNAIDKAIGKQDNISSWFSLQDLKAYIEYVESEGVKKGIEITGIRAYLGAYAEGNPNPNKKNYTTVFFVPTKKRAPSVGAMSASSGTHDPDAEDVDGLNDGQSGIPPGAPYPQ